MSGRVNLADINKPSAPFRKRPLEEIIGLFIDSEKGRNDDSLTPFADRAVSISYHTTISGLETSIERLCSSDALGIGAQVMQRCMAYQYTDWLYNLPEMRGVTKRYSELLVQADDLGMDDVGSWIKHTEGFQLVSPAITKATSKTTSFSTVGKLKSALHAMSVATGIDEYKLASIGLAWSITTNTKSWSAGNIRKYFQPEVQHLVWHLDERLMFLDLYESVINKRVLRLRKQLDNNGLHKNDSGTNSFPKMFDETDFS